MEKMLDNFEELWVNFTYVKFLSFFFFEVLKWYTFISEATVAVT